MCGEERQILSYKVGRKLEGRQFFGYYAEKGFGELNDTGRTPKKKVAYLDKGEGVSPQLVPGEGLGEKGIVFFR